MKIGIVGCGWLGKPLAKELAKSYEVECFTRKTITDDSLNYIYDPQSNDEFWNNEIIIVSISTKDNYLQTLQKIAYYTNSSSKIILMSSTSVYREFDSTVNKDVKITKIGLQKEAEELMLSLRKKLVILRLGGLMGYDRISGKWKSVSTFTDGPVNYVYRDDVIGVVKKVIEKSVENGIFDVVAPKHPLRSEVHEKNSKQFGFKLGTFEGETNRKVIDMAIIKELGYDFLYPDPLNFWN
jgi:nucleoside-diphosphate-sugar epimerase